MPAFQPIPATPTQAPSAYAQAVAAGVRVALPAGPGWDFIITNLGVTDVFVATEDGAVVCTVPAGATPGVPVLGRTQPILKVRPGSTHIFLITASGTSDVVLTPGAGE